MSEPVAISVKNVSKNFRLPHQKTSSIKDVFVRPLQAIRGGRTVEVQHALKDISFDVKEGEFFGIVGRNGSGKSTLLKILAEIYQPTSGEVSVKGRLVPFIELGVGFNPELTGRENVYLSGALNGFSEKEIDDMYDEIVDFAELGPFMDQKLKNYSSGMQVRLAFSVATRANADILLIDEVLAVGDADFQRKCFNYFKELKRNKKTVVFVSHDMEAIREYCDRCVLIEKNRIKAIDSPSVIASAYTKLFSDPSARAEGYSSKQWGNGKATTENLSVRIEDNTVIVEHKLLANQMIDEYEIGFRIRSLAGQALAGTNSKIVRMELPTLQAGESKTFTWKIPNIFSDGTYLLDVATVEADGVTTIEWFDEAARFEVMREVRSPYPFDPLFELSYDK